MVEHLEVSGHITWQVADPVSIELARGQRGGYGWTIKVHGKEPADILARIGDIDQRLRDNYQPEVPA